MTVPSAIGYGWNPYGTQQGGLPFQGPGPGPYLMFVGYGHGDWAEEVTWRILPAWMRDDDGTVGDVVEPLRGFVDAVKPLLNELIAKWRIFPALWDANACPLPQLAALAHTIGITLDPTKSERLQRSEVLNAAQLFIHKGTDLGYSILAAFEDLLVEITPLWASDCTPAAVLSPTPPALFVPHFDEVPADDIPLDFTSDDQYALWPRTLFPVDVCRSHSLRLVFYPSANPNQDFDPDVAGRIAARLLRFKPIHVEIDRITFDGLRGSSQTWVAPVAADNSAAGMWVQAVVAEQRAASQTWVQLVDANPTP
jgi:hypothetical protein